jgi:hypothetical protein
VVWEQDCPVLRTIVGTDDAGARDILAAVPFDKTGFADVARKGMA